MSKYIESCRTKSIQEFYVMLVTYRYKFVALKRFVAFKYNFVTIIFCNNQKSNSKSDSRGDKSEKQQKNTQHLMRQEFSL